jgi:uncharacterized membrane protein
MECLIIKHLLNILPPIGTIVLALIFCFANPYNSTPHNPETIVIVFVLLIVPGMLVIISYLMQRNILKYIGFYSSLPVGIYLGIVNFPSYWNLFILFIFLYPFIKTKQKHMQV